MFGVMMWQVFKMGRRQSIVIMPKPKYETWFMEGTLIPDYHYIFIK